MKISVSVIENKSVSVSVKKNWLKSIGLPGARCGKIIKEIINHQELPKEIRSILSSFGSSYGLCSFFVKLGKMGTNKRSHLKEIVNHTKKKIHLFDQCFDISFYDSS